MAFSPIAQSQFQPVTATSPDDCVPTTCAEAVERATVGAVRVNHSTIRKADPTPAPGGMSYQDAYLATKKATGVVGEPRFGISAPDLKALLVAGHSVTISVDTHALAGTACGLHFLGKHSEFINSYSAAMGTFRMDDPGTTPVGFHDCPAALIVKAALLRTGNHGINVIVWPDTEGVSWKAAKVHSLRDLPSYTTGEGRGMTKIGTTYLGGRTQNADPYALGTRTANGWVHVKDPITGKWLWTIGDSFHA
jgi:hypothetical protein